MSVRVCPSSLKRDRLRGGGAGSQAIPLHEQTLADQERVLGPDHPDTMAAPNILAWARSNESKKAVE